MYYVNFNNSYLIKNALSFLITWIRCFLLRKTNWLNFPFEKKAFWIIFFSSTPNKQWLQFLSFSCQFQPNIIQLELIFATICTINIHKEDYKYS